MIDTASDLTDDAFLGGRLRIYQRRKGHRSGHDAILLAASTPIVSGDRVVEFGAGVGVAGLAVALRAKGVALTLVDNDAAMVELATTNAQRNGVAAACIQLDIGARADAFFEAGLEPDSFDRAMMNPPFNDPARHQASPDGPRRAAHQDSGATLDIWVHAARRLLKPGGTLTLIWRAEGLADVLAALGRGFGGVVILPVHPKSGAAAIRVLVRATKGSRAPIALSQGIMLGDEAGRPEAAINDVLRGDNVLPLAEL
jgi:tRNA1(Val) A37 N6-methylase TrmN6